MSTPVVAYQYDPTKSINYIGPAVENGDEPYPDGGPVAVGKLHTALVSAHDLDALELASSGKVVFTTDGTEKALEISGLGINDPTVVDTTVLDGGDKNLRITSKGARFDASDITFAAASSIHSYLRPDAASDPTSHFVSTPERMLLGSGVLDAGKNVVSGSFLKTTPDAFELGHDMASIKSVAGAQSQIRYDAAHGHEFFAGSDASSAVAGTGVIEILSDKVIIRKDVDLVGNLNSTATESSVLNVEDQIIRLARSDDPTTANRDALLQYSKTGLTIETVPGSYDDDGAYMSQFKGPDGTKLFVDDAAGTIDVDKANESGVFTKELCFHLNDGAKSSGARTQASRLSEPFWKVSGGALHLTRTVPDGNGKAKEFALGFRIADDGSMEMCRMTRKLVWDTPSTGYVSDPVDTGSVNVVARYINPVA